MHEKVFDVEIITPERSVLKEKAVSVVVQGVEGSLGVLADHAPMVVELAIGEVKIRHADGRISMLAAGGGFMEVKDNRVRILADTAERAEEIDIARAEAALRRAESRLREKAVGLDRERAEAALKRALTRLKVARGRGEV